LRSGARLVPLPPLGFSTQAVLVSHLARFLGASVADEAVVKLVSEGARADPCVLISAPFSDWNGPEKAETTALAVVDQLKHILSWATGDEIRPIGIVIVGSDGTSYFRILPPQSRRRQRLGFGNTGKDFTASLERIMKCVEEDEHFAFALSMLHDANRESNPTFRIARLYSCLESLAYRLKKGQGSRDAVRELLGIGKGGTSQVQVDGRKYDVDEVLGAGILRDMLFHGVKPEFDKSKSHERDTFDFLEAHPVRFADSLQSRVELEFARWSNGASNGQTNVA